MTARLAERSEFDRAARVRWVRWYVQFVSSADFASTWDAPDKFEQLDIERETIDTVVAWAAAHQLPAEVVKLAQGIEYYYYIRGLWDKKLELHHLYADAARSLGALVEEFAALALHIQLLSRQGNCHEAELYVPRFRELAESADLSADLFFRYHHTLVLYWMARHDLAAAQQAWEQSLQRAEQFSPHTYIGNIQWLATCLYEKGDLAQAQQLYSKALELSRQHHYRRYIALTQLKLVRIDLDMKNLEQAEKRADGCACRGRPDAEPRAPRAQVPTGSSTACLAGRRAEGASFAGSGDRPL
jgi:ATP/maltotriose-dependent transcriptional regulator MalT